MHRALEAGPINGVRVCIDAGLQDTMEVVMMGVAAEKHSIRNW
jgi:hypothetical protein